MPVDRSKFSCFSDRAKCLVIGYLHLLSILVNIGCHLLMVFIVTGGFQCDSSMNGFRAIDWQWLQFVLFSVNLGTHGFYPFPFIFTSLNSAYVEDIPISVLPKCYPGMLHVYLIDLLNFLINVIWLRLVITFVAAVHKKEPEKMRMFFGLLIMKVALQLVYIAFHPNFRISSSVPLWLIQLVDIGIAARFMVIINKYIKTLLAEKKATINDQPPPYIECLITSTSQIQTPIVKKEINNVLSSEETKKDNSPAVLPI